MTRIKKIHKLNLASFRNFCWNTGVSEFSDCVNVFLGWNWSWKTAISRLFLSLEKNELSKRISDWSFEIHIDGNKHTQASLIGFQDQVRVFNEDYVGGIIGEWKLPHIVYIWDTAVDYSKQEKLVWELNDEIARIRPLDNFTELAKNQAAEIKTIPWISNLKKELQTGIYNAYDATSFGKRISNLEEKLAANSALTIETYILKVETVAEHKRKLANQEQKKKQFEIIERLSSWLLDELSGINTLLEFQPTASISSRIEAFLKEEKDWIEKGVVLHGLNEETKKDACLFCGWNIWNAEELLRHFTKDVLILSGKIKTCSDEVRSAISELNSVTEFYQTEKKWLLASLKAIQEELIRKEEDKSYCPEGTIVFQSLLVNESSSAEELDDIARELEIHYVAQKYSEYRKNKDTFDEQTKRKRELETQRNEVQKELVNLKAKEKDLHLAPEKLNKLLELTFPYKKIKLENSPDGVWYILTRSGNKCSLSELSEWERNFIALVYFLISINSNWSQSTLSPKGVVLIDDPISSLDKNSIFQVFSLIATEVQSKPDRQYFLLTHNLDFFAHLHTHFKPKKAWEASSRDGKFYQISFWSGGSVIGNLSNLLANYRTDYQYAISKLQELQNSADLEDAFLAVNLLRRVIETFLQFKFGDWDYRTKLEQMHQIALNRHLVTMEWAPETKKDEVRRDYLARNKALYNFTNYGSHKFSGTDTVDEALLLSSWTIIKDFLKTLKSVDKEHYESIVPPNS